MGFYRGPHIITDGLAVSLDAGNTKSYTGTGALTWFDKSGLGNNGVLTNGPTFNSGNGGSIVFDGTNDGVELVHNSTWVLTPSTKFSICGWFYADPATSAIGSMLFSHQNCNAPVIQIVIAGTTSIYFRLQSGAGTSFATYTANITGKWNYYTATFDGTPGNMKLYINSNLVATSTSTGWSTYTPGHSKVWLGRRADCGGTNEYTGKIAQFSFYKDKELTAQEIQQNYNATKSRYGL